MLRPKYDVQIQYSQDPYRRLTVSVIVSRVTENVSDELMDSIAAGLNTEGVKVTKPLGEYLRIIWDNYYAMQDIVKEILSIMKEKVEIEELGFAPAIGETPQPVPFEFDLSKVLSAKDSFDILVRLKVKEEA